MNPLGKKRKLTPRNDVVTPPDLTAFNALANGNLEEVLKDDQNINVNERGRGGCTCLHIACEKYDKDAIKLLLQHESIDVNVREVSGRTPFMLLLERNLHLYDYDDELGDIIELFWHDERVDLNVASHRNQTTIIHIILRECYNSQKGIEFAKKLLTMKRTTMKLDINIKDASGNPIWLCRPEFLSDESLLNLIVAHESFNVNTVDSDLFIWGFTSLSTLYRSYHDG